ncbi:MAG TPA: HEAT repeat domain-containing protein, partial [Phycisphaerae bacterium]
QDKLASERQRRLQQTKTWKRQQTEAQYAEYQGTLARARDRLAVIDGGAPDIVRKIAELNEGDWRRAFAIGCELAAMPADQGFALLNENWGRITSVDARQQLLKAWYFTVPYPLHVRMHPHILDVLHLGATDPSPGVQGWAFDYLRSIAFEDFAENYPAYLAWHARQANRPLYDVLKEGCREYVERLRTAAATERPALLRLLGNVAALLRDDEAVRQVALDAGALDVFSGYLSDGTATPQELSAVGSALMALHPPESYLRNLTLPRTGRGTPMNVRLEAIRLLGTPQNKWAVDHLEQLLVQCLADPDELKHIAHSIVQALAAIDDPRVIPTMIGVIAADNTYDTVYGVGYFGLGKLTGVEYDEKHDAAWWGNWWEINKARFPREVQERPIPVLGTTHEPRGG